MKEKTRAIFYAIAAASFYALNVPCSKLLLRHTPPTIMAGLLYIGAGLGVGVVYLFDHKKERSDGRHGHRHLLAELENQLKGHAS